MAKRKQGLIAGLLTGTMALFLGMLLLLAFSFNINYNEANGFPAPAKNGVMSLKDYSLIDNPKGTIASGEWELFYNKWIITDNLTDIEADSIISLPSYWTGKKTKDGETMKKNAFVSLRLTLLNIEEGEGFYVQSIYSATQRIYINGQLSLHSGTMSKTDMTRSSVVDTIIPYTVLDGSKVEIVVELSYNNYGGMNYIPWIFNSTNRQSDSGASIIDFFSRFMPGVIFGFVMFSFAMSLGGGRKLSSVTMPIFTLLAFIQLLTTTEVCYQYSTFLPFFNYSFVLNLCFFLFHILPATFLAHLILQKLIDLKKYELAGFGGFSIVLFIMFYCLWGTFLMFLPLVLLAVSYLFIFYKLSVSTINKKPYALSHLFMMIPLLILVLLIPLDLLGVLIYPLYPSFSWMLFLIASVFTVMSYKTMRDNTRRAMVALDLEKQNAVLESELVKVKQQALQAQIKPHFIFNALSSIQALYEKDNRDGSNALDIFASHLRQNIDSNVNDTIPFDQEISNIQNYVDLENLRLEKKLTLLFDVEYTDFEIPALSLQPFIENAIKYADTQNMDDGYILVESKLLDDEIVVRVIDNGKSFDVNNIRKNAVGIKNCVERLRLILNAKTTIESAVNKGTTITIKIPLKIDKDLIGDSIKERA